MKKLIAIIAALALMFALTACRNKNNNEQGGSGGPGSGTTQPENGSGGSGENGGSGGNGGNGSQTANTSRTRAFFDRYANSGAYTMTLTGADGDMTYAYNGGDYSFLSTAGGISSRSLSLGNNMYLVSDDMKSYSRMSDTAEKNRILSLLNTAELDDAGMVSGAYSYDNRIYDSEQYKTGNGSVYYLFDKDELAYILYIEEGEIVSWAKIGSVRSGADSGLFSLPESYTDTTATP